MTYIESLIRRQERTDIEAYIRNTIDRICEDKKKAGKHPPRATWRELRDTFEDKHWPILEEMVQSGVITKQDAINFPTYAVDWRKYNEERAFDRAAAKMMR